MVSAQNNDFVLNGPAPAADFAPSGEIQLWEYGVGDRVRMPSEACVRRVEPGVYEVSGNTDMEVTLGGGKPHRVLAGSMPLRLEAGKP